MCPESYVAPALCTHCEPNMLAPVLKGLLKAAYARACFCRCHGYVTESVTITTAMFLFFAFGWPKL